MLGAAGHQGCLAFVVNNRPCTGREASSRTVAASAKRDVVVRRGALYPPRSADVWGLTRQRKEVTRARCTQRTQVSRGLAAFTSGLGTMFRTSVRFGSLEVSRKLRGEGDRKSRTVPRPPRRQTPCVSAIGPAPGMSHGLTWCSPSTDAWAGGPRTIDAVAFDV